MKVLGGMIIGVILAAINICPIDFKTNTFDLGDTIILIGIIILWNIVCSILEDKGE